MFDKKQRDAYGSIKAPDALKSKILDNCRESTVIRKNKKYTSHIVSAAACFVFVLGVLFAVRHTDHDVNISVDGYSLADRPVVVHVRDDAEYHNREITPGAVNIPVSIDRSGEVYVSVNDGTLYVTDKLSGDILYVGSEYVGDSDEIIHWTIEINKAGYSAELVARSGHNEVRMVVEYDHENGIFSLTQK